MTIEIDLNEELEILCLITEIRECPARERLVKHFGFDISVECPARKKLKEFYDKWKAEQRANYPKEAK